MLFLFAYYKYIDNVFNITHSMKASARGLEAILLQHPIKAANCHLLRVIQ